MEVENGKKQPWYITRKANQPIFMAGLTNFRHTHIRMLRLASLLLRKIQARKWLTFMTVDLLC